MFTLFFALISLFADILPSLPQEEPHEIVVHNRILIKVREKTISVVDVMKQMDVYLNRYYPHLSHSKIAKFQFYSTHWRNTLNQMIDTELMVADAESREVKVTDGEVRESLQERFGPNVMAALENLGLTYDEARKMVHEDLLVQRMNWFRVTAKARQKITMDDTKKAYRDYCTQNPAKETWHYQVLSIRATEEMGSAVAEKASLLLKEVPDLDAVAEKMKSEQAADSSVAIAISPVYKTEDKDLSASHRDILQTLSKGIFSGAIAQKSRDASTVFRIFHLKDHIKTRLPKFEEIASQLQDQLLQQKANEEMATYVSKLRKRFSYDQATLEENIPHNFEPFTLE